MKTEIKQLLRLLILTALCVLWVTPGFGATDEQNKPFVITNPIKVDTTPAPQVESPDASQMETQIKTAISKDLDIVFVIDNSGSMKQNDPKFITKDVVKNFLGELDENVRLGMVVFDENARLIQPLATKSDAEGQTRLLKGLAHVNYKGLFTNSPDGIERAIYELKNNGRDNVDKLIIFLTDGIVDTGNEKMDLENAKWLKEELANEAQKAKIRIIGIAFTDNADFRLIQALAFKTNGEYYRAYNADDIPAVFKNIKKLLSQPKVVNPPVEAVAQAAPPVVVAPPVQPETVQASQRIQENAPMQPEGYATPERPTSPVFSYILISVIVLLSAIILVKFFRDRNQQDNADFMDTHDTSIETGRAGDPAMPQAELIDVENISAQQTSSLLLAKKKVTIGRDTNNDIVIPHNTISSFHATIEYNNGYFYVEDHRSTNGTRLNGKRVQQNAPVILKSGDKIDFANYEFRFLLFDQAPLGETVMFMRDDMKTMG